MEQVENFTSRALRAIRLLHWGAILLNQTLSCRGLAQLVEHRSPKPRVKSSSLLAPASIYQYILVSSLNIYLFGLSLDNTLDNTYRNLCSETLISSITSILHQVYY